MTNQIMFYTVVAACLLSTTVSSQQEQKAAPDNVQSPTGTIIPTNPNNQKDFWPMVNVDRPNPNKTKVDVHVPIFFDMTNDKDEQAGRAKLDLSVLSGLVTVNRDKARGANGTITGPLVVTVFGIPVYSGYATGNGGISPAQSLRRNRADEVQNKAESESPLESIRSTLLDKSASLTKPTHEMILKVKKVEDNYLGSLSDMLKRITSVIDQRTQDKSNLNGLPSFDSKLELVKPANFSKSDFEQKALPTPKP